MSEKNPKSFDERDVVLSEMFEAVPQGVVAIDSTGVIVRINDNACRMFGHARDQVVGAELSVLIPAGYHGAHATHIGTFFGDPQRRMMGYGTGELWGRRRDGSEFPVDVGLSSVEIDGSRLALAFVTDVSNRRRSEQELQRNRAKLQQLARQLNTAAEEESRKWARELHDVYSQRLVGVAMELARIAGDPVREVETQVRALAEDIHHLSRSMHPNILHDLGLVAALKSETEAFERAQGVRTEFLRNDVPNALPADVALCFYRVAQESLRNIRKHSGADRVTLKLDGSQTRLLMTVEDMGDGFELDRVLRTGGLGLISMEERVLAVGGDFSVDSAVGRGTIVKVSIPLQETP